MHSFDPLSDFYGWRAVAGGPEAPGGVPPAAEADRAFRMAEHPARRPASIPPACLAPVQVLRHRERVMRLPVLALR